MSQRLPVVGSDDDTWGSILNGFLAVSLNSDGTVASNTIGSAQIQNNAVGTNQLATSAITSTQIAAGAVGTSAIANNAVTNAQLDTTTQNILTSVASKYVKPGGGIPSTDLDAYSQTALANADTAVQTVNSVTPTSGNVTITAGSIGAVANTTTVNGHALSSNVTVTASDVSAIPTSQLGVASGVATLNGSSQLTNSQIPNAVLNSSGTTAGEVLVATGSGNNTWRNPSSWDVRDYGCKADVLTITDGAISTTGNTLSSASQYTFTSGDVGKIAIVQNGQATGIPFVASISSVGAGVATLSNTVPGSLSGLTVDFGTDDTPSLYNAVKQLGILYTNTGVRQTLEFGNRDVLVNWNDPTAYNDGISDNDALVLIAMRSGVHLHGTGKTRIVCIPPPMTLTTSSVTISSTPSTVPVISTSNFTPAFIEGKTFVITSVPSGGGTYAETASWTGLATTSLTGVTGSSNTFPSGSAVVLNCQFNVIGSDIAHNCNDWEVSGIIIDGQSHAAAEMGGQLGVMVYSTNSVTFNDWSIHDCEIRYLQGKGIMVYGTGGFSATRFRIEDNTIHGCGSNSLSLDGPCSDFIVRNNFVHDSLQPFGQEGLISGSTNQYGLIEGNIIWNCGTIDVAGTDMVYVGNWINEAYGGPSIDFDRGGSGCVFRDNIIDATQLTSPGNVMYGAGLYTDLDITGNKIYLPNLGSSDTMYLTQITNSGNSIDFSHNRVTVPGGTCYYLVNLAGTDMVCTGNRLEGLAGGGMSVGSGSGLVSVIGNIINGAGLGVNGIGGTVAGNTVVNTPNSAAGPGIQVSGTSMAVSGNSVTWAGPNAQGIVLHGATHSSVTGNTLQYSGTTTAVLAVNETNSADYNVYSNNALYASSSGSLGSTMHRGSLGSHSVVFDNYLENFDTPLDAPTSQPAVPSSGTVYTNALGTNCMVYVTGGTVSAIAINGLTTGLTSGAFRVKVGHSITITYSGLPTWAWVGE